MDSAILPDGSKYLAKANGIIPTIWQSFEVVPATYWTHFRNDEKLTIHARQRLLQSNDAIKQISEQVGYNGPFFFSRDFKRYTGVSPSEYRRQQLAVRVSPV
jgi:transcriptional regulator GlxA family with amidase domain